MNTEVEELVLEDLGIDLEHTITVFNDDINTFDHVIDAFVEILNHTPQQAEQCAFIVHTKGKCAVKKGSYRKLEPLCTAILNRGIAAEIF